MKITVAITTDPIERTESRVDSTDSCGAEVEFYGVVRAEEGGNQIEALRYEAYQPMAEQEMERLLRELESQFPCEGIEVIHRIGSIPVGEAAIRVRVLARHRAEAFGLMTSFMDRLKQDVPIWKVANTPASQS